MGISGFGRKAKQFDLNEMIQKARKNAPKPVEKEPESDEEVIGPMPGIAEPVVEAAGPSKTTRTKKKKESADSDDDDDSDDEESGDDEEDTVDYKIPASHEVEMLHGTKAVTAMTTDASGARLASGSIDYELNFWDFTGMDKSMRAFRKVCSDYLIQKFIIMISSFFRFNPARIIQSVVCSIP